MARAQCGRQTDELPGQHEAAGETPVSEHRGERRHRFPDPVITLYRPGAVNSSPSFRGLHLPLSTAIAALTVLVRRGILHSGGGHGRWTHSGNDRRRLGGLIGAAVWAAITYFANAEIGWIAWGIGLVTGFGVRAMCSDEHGPALGVVAAVIAVLSIVVGKFAAIELLLQKELGDFDPPAITANDMIVVRADQIVGQREEQGRDVVWPEGMTIEEAFSEEDYPPDIWQEAKTQWDELGAEEQQRLIAERQAETEEAMQGLMDLVRQEAFKASFGLLDIVFFLLAVVTAFKVGAGDGSESRPEPTEQTDSSEQDEQTF